MGFANVSSIASLRHNFCFGLIVCIANVSLITTFVDTSCALTVFVSAWCGTAAEACAAAEEAQVLAAEAQAAADERAAELRVAQDSLRTMREECNERWVSSFSRRVLVLITDVCKCCS